MCEASHLANKVADWRLRIRAAAAGSSRPRLTPAVLHPGPQPAVVSAPRQQFLTHQRQWLPPCHTNSSPGRSMACAAAASPSSAAAAASAAALSVGEVVQVTCERLGTDGMGVCLYGPSRLVLLVKNALPGEQLTAVVTAVRKKYAEGCKLSTQQPHRDAAEPACQHFGSCGGCSLQALTYPAQLAHKSDHVSQLLARVGRLDAAAVAAAQQPAIAAAAVYGYRNKVQLAFSSLVWEAGQGQEQLQQQQEAPGGVRQGFGLGYFLPGSSSVVLPIQECSLASAEANRVISEVRGLCQAHGLQPHNSPCGSGVLRHLIVRSAAAAAETADPAKAAGSTSSSSSGSTPEGNSTLTAADAAAGPPRLMAVLVTTAAVSDQPLALGALSEVAQQLMHSCPGLASVVHSIEAAPASPGATASSSKPNNRQQRPRGAQQPGRSNGRGSSSGGSAGQQDSDSDGDGSGSSRGAQPLRVQSSRVLAGASSLEESLCGLRFRVSPHSFFQTNTAQAERLYQLVVQAVAEAVGEHAAVAGVAAGSEQPAPEGSGPGGVVLDLYCGTGTIALCLARSLIDTATEVVGFDVSPSSIADAEANAARNGLSNVRFVCGDLNRLLPAAEKQEGRASSGSSGGNRSNKPGSRTKPAQASSQQSRGSLQQLRPEVVVVDPARAGLGRGVVQYLLQCGAGRVVYVSCNAATQARDVQLLCGASGGFRVSSWTCVDLFPQTDVSHVETVVVLDRVAAQ